MVATLRGGDAAEQCHDPSDRFHPGFGDRPTRLAIQDEARTRTLLLPLVDVVGAGTTLVTKADICQMPASDLDQFLFARVGTQPNGVDLTVLSLLARLGTDPWMEAARLALLPRAAATEWLAQRIASTQISAHAVDATEDTAATLLRLLPVRTSVGKVVMRATVKGDEVAKWVIGAIVAAGVLGVLGASLHTLPPASPNWSIQGEP